MTPDDRRQFLESRDFIVAKKPFPGSSGPLWFAQEPALSPVANKDRFGPHNLLIDLTTGRWQRWGQATWSPWDRGPWHEQVEIEQDEPSGQQTSTDQSVALSVRPTGTAFIHAGPVKERPYILVPKVTDDGRQVESIWHPNAAQFYVDCVERAGFVITDPGPDQLLDGFRDLASRWAVRDGVKYLLIAQTNVISILGPGLREYSLDDFLNPEPTPRPVLSTPRRELSAIKVTVQSSGNTLQKGLF